MSPTEALRIVKDAMTVIVDEVVGTYTDPSESYQKKYRKLEAVNEDLILTLYSMDIGKDYTRKYVESARLAERIRDFYIDNGPSCLISEIKPERWMFKTQDGPQNITNQKIMGSGYESQGTNIC